MADGPAGGRGKWSQAGVPHKGWSCVNYEDLGEPSMHCQMCESSEIRYVQYMWHPQYPETLACGAICAGHMEQNLVGAEHREKQMRGNARKRDHFPKRKAWYVNRNGRHQIKIGAFTVTMFQKPSGWGAVVNHPRKKDGTFTRERFSELEDAQRAAFDALTYLQSELLQGRL